MKWIVGALLLLNLAAAGVIYALTHGLLGGEETEAPLNVDRLSLASPTRPADAGDVMPGQPAPQPRALCVEWRGLSLGEVVQVREQLKALAGERAMSFTEVPLNTRSWVIFPPLPSAQSANEKLKELNAAGVQDAFVVKTGPWRNALSLGLYANAEAAARRVREVEARGVLGTRVESVPKQGTDFYFVIKSEDPDALKGLSDIKQPYTNSRQSRVACPS
ncbi:MAG: hypothetical protein LDL19_03330 [Thiobacillus sp.]|nr:hypothetical protein [Thiobacillus sp.]